VTGMGKMLILLGLLICLAGVLVLLSGKIPWIGRLPGDIFIRKGNYSFYFPVATCILISLLLTLIVRFLRK